MNFKIEKSHTIVPVQTDGVIILSFFHIFIKRLSVVSWHCHYDNVILLLIL